MLQLIDASMDHIADGRADEAQQCAEAAADALDSAPDSDERVAVLLMRLSALFGDVGAFDTARAAAERALTIQRRVNGHNSLRVAETLSNLADLCADQQDWDESSTYLAEAATLFELNRALPELAHTLLNLATIRWRVGDVPDARDLAEKALEVFAQLDASEHAADMAACNAILDAVQ